RASDQNRHEDIAVHYFSSFCFLRWPFVNQDLGIVTSPCKSLPWLFHRVYKEYARTRRLGRATPETPNELKANQHPTATVRSVMFGEACEAPSGGMHDWLRTISE